MSTTYYCNKCSEQNPIEKMVKNLSICTTCDVWSITRKQLKRLTLDLGADCVHIYVDNKDKAEPIHIAYWLIDEWEADAEVAVSIFKAIQWFYLDKKELLKILGYNLVD